MKSAKEWVDGPDGLWNLTCTHESDHTEEQLIEFVQKIQDDAEQHGRLQAHKIRDAEEAAGR